jgi:hypothetical protein
MQRVHRTYWVVHQRYRRAGYLGSVLGAVIAGILIAPHVHGAQWGVPGAAPTDLLPGIAAFVAAVVVPPLLARLCWRVHRRFFADMYLLTPH